MTPSSSSGRTRASLELEMPGAEQPAGATNELHQCAPRTTASALQNNGLLRARTPTL